MSDLYSEDSLAVFSVTYGNQPLAEGLLRDSYLSLSLCAYAMTIMFKAMRCGGWFTALCLSLSLAFCLALFLSVFMSAPALAQAPEVSSAATVPVVSGGVAFVPFVQAGQTTLVSIISPVVLVPLGDNWLIESRAAFEGDFVRRDGTGPFGGEVQKSLEYLQLDYIANPHLTVTVGRFLTPFSMYNERLYPVWIRDLQADPLILPLEQSSSNGMMLRGGFSAAPNLNLNYAAYFSTLSNNQTLASDREVGGRIVAFFPNQRAEIGFSVGHLLQQTNANRFGTHFEWQPRAFPLDMRSEYANTESGQGYWIEPALRLSALSHLPILARTQVVGRFQQFFTKPGATNDDVPGANTREPEVGLNYYFMDGLRATGSYGRQLSSEGNANVWTAGMTYRFAFPLGRGGY